ncbi:hypothetical protein COO60DRAFT_665355 [Scenedesmus sp. NREL 46B-D3]|nr:hypothetical protein COO60DRAFT_665355 [Scenedesmus sp. NREL 46B-D3]
MRSVVLSLQAWWALMWHSQPPVMRRTLCLPSPAVPGAAAHQASSAAPSDLRHSNSDTTQCTYLWLTATWLIG